MSFLYFTWTPLCLQSIKWSNCSTWQDLSYPRQPLLPLHYIQIFSHILEDFSHSATTTLVHRRQDSGHPLATETNSWWTIDPNLPWALVSPQSSPATSFCSLVSTATAAFWALFWCLQASSDSDDHSPPHGWSTRPSNVGRYCCIHRQWPTHSRWQFLPFQAVFRPANS